MKHEHPNCRAGMALGMMFLCLAAITGRADLEVVTNSKPQQVFFGDGRSIEARFHNRGDKTVDGDISIRLYQVSQATATRLGETPWKRLQVPPGQTVIESASISFPEVKAKTRFLAQWIINSNSVIGTSDVIVYPTNLLGAFKAIGEDKPIGLFDPHNTLRPLLKAAGVDTAGFAGERLDVFSGKLAIAWMPAKIVAGAEYSEGAIDAESLRKLAAKGVPVLWIEPEPAPTSPLKPSFYTVPESNSAVTVVHQRSLVANLAESPQAQLNLLELAELAKRHQQPGLPQTMSKTE